MRIDVLTVLPKLFEGPLSDSILKRAQDKGLVEIHLHNLRDFSTDKHKNVDDYQYGGGAGMVMRIEPIAACIEHLKKQRDYDEIIYMTPDGSLLEQGVSNFLSTQQNLMILCGHYKGVDERVRQTHHDAIDDADALKRSLARTNALRKPEEQRPSGDRARNDQRCANGTFK